jgi:uncharacterized protein DUF1496
LLLYFPANEHCEYIMNRPALRITRRLALLLLIGSAISPLVATPVHAADSVCVYQSKSYSEGAFICVQKSLMQSCTSDGSRLVWRVVADKDLGDRCAGPLQSVESRKWTPRRHRVAHRPAPAPAQQASAKCFMFNGNRYCE